MARASAVRRLDPEREVRRARQALEVADTAANRTDFGDALAGRREWGEAAVQHGAAMARVPGGDRAARLKLARAEL